MIGSTLTPREREVFIKISEGDSSKEIARDLGISHRTVECHVEHIRGKFDGMNRSALAAQAAAMLMAEAALARGAGSVVSQVLPARHIA